MKQRIAATLAGLFGLLAGMGIPAATTGSGTAQSAADALVSDFVYESLALAPVSASAAGYHIHKGVRLEGRWDDYSIAGLARQRSFNRDLLRRLDALQHASLDAERQADLDIVRDGVGLKLLELDRIQSFRHNPTLYVELIGNGLNSPFQLEYAPPATRYQDIIDRLKRLPALLAQARANLLDAPEVWNRVAREENAGNIELIDSTLRAAVPAEQGAAFAAAAEPALRALRDFNDYLATTLAGKTSDWRLGKDNYERKCSYVLHIGRTPSQLLADAEAGLTATRAEMARLAAPRSVEEALAGLASQHATAAGYMDEVRRTLAQATDFVRQKDLLALSAGSNLAVIETPVFMRGAYGLGGFNPAPALEPRLGAFYWVTPIPADWPSERVESKLRENNHYGLQHLTIHEAMPGHYVQAEYANRIEPKVRRVLRNVWGNGPYVEGWAVYTQQLMTDEGYLDHDPGLRLTFLKQLLRSEANTILDVRLQTMGMSEQEALELMMKQTYQEREEAVAKIQRAQLSSCQLDMYYAGLGGWNAARTHYQQSHAKDYSLKAFHERALQEGPVPLPVLDRLLQRP
jgi:uncharacterized protein (DUF885 family)